ncbi:MAG TPA: hypothetical protein VGL93_19135 [Streptosporangiaceae bacterium]
MGLLGGVSGAGHAGAAYPAIAAAVCAVFFGVDVWVLARGRMFSIGLPRQTPKMITYRRGAMLGAFVWGLDTGTAVSTFRVSATTWAALGLTVLGIAPPLTGVAYGIGFAVPLAVAVLVPRWRPDDDDGNRYEPRWIPRMLQLHVRTVQVAGLVALAGSVVVLAGCSASHGGPSADGTRRSPPATTADAACPAPAPVQPSTVPRTLVTGAGGDGWYGSGPLWTQGIGAGMTRAGAGYRLKYGSFTLDDRGTMSPHAGRPRLAVHRVDAPGTGHASVRAYGNATGNGDKPISFWPTVIALPHSGCWQITESLHHTTLHFHVHAP